MIKPWTKIHTYILVGIILTVPIIYGISYLSILKPLQTELSTLEAEVSMYENQYEDLMNQTDGQNEDVSDVTLKIPAEKSADNVLTNLESIANTTDVAIDYISTPGATNDTEENSEGSSLNETVYTLDVTATNLNDMNAFLEEMEKSERLMIIDTIDLQQEEDEVYLSITFSTYYTG